MSSDFVSRSQPVGPSATDLTERLDEVIRAGRAPGLQGFVILSHSRLVLEHYGEGQDMKWGDSLGSIKFGPDVLHDIRSVTKSIVGLLYGIALAQGRVPEPSEALLTHFPEYQDLASDPRRARLTVEHALTMTLGLEWNEDVPYTSAENSEIAMELAPDRHRYVLERPIVEEPGARWRYCGGASAIVGQLISKGTSLPFDEFARKALFEPLGIDNFEWMSGGDGVASAASGLRLTPRDLARVGQLVLDRGNWDGREVVPTAWLGEVLQPRVTIGTGFDYGYQWYLGNSPEFAGGSVQERWFAGMGNGGQRLVVFPDLELVAAITAGNYDSPDQSTTPRTILVEMISPSIRRS